MDSAAGDYYRGGAVTIFSLPVAIALRRRIALALRPHHAVRYRCASELLRGRYGSTQDYRVLSGYR